MTRLFGYQMFFIQRRTINLALVLTLLPFFFCLKAAPGFSSSSSDS